MNAARDATADHDSSSGVDVVVIGAGMAGAAAAATIRAAGRSVIVLEARHRIGGRVDTRWLAPAYRPDGPVAVEAGAQVLHGSATHVLDVVELAAVSGALVPVDRGAIDTSLTDADGVARAFSDSGPDFVSPVVLATRLKLMARALGAAVAARTSLESALMGMRVSPASAAALRAWYEQVTGSPATAVPLLEVTGARVYQYHGEREYRAPGGLLRLVDETLGDVPVLCGWQASRIHVPEHGAGAAGRTGEPIIVTGLRDGAPARVRAQCVVVTVPPPIIGAGTLVIDGMPAEHVRRAASVALADAVTAIVPLQRPTLQAGFHFDISGPLGFTSWEAGAGHVTVIAKGAAAPRLRAAAARPGGVASAVRHGIARLDVLPDPDGVVVTDWGMDPYAGGAFTLPRAASAADASAWASPIGGRVFFAGESTGAGSGAPFLDRAYGTGRTAARSALQALSSVEWRRPA